MLIEHRIHNVDESLVAREKAMTARKQIPFQPALTHVLAEDFHDSPVGRKVLIDGETRLHPNLVRGLKHSIKAIGRGLIGPEDTEISMLIVEFHHVAQKGAQDFRGLSVL